MEKDPQKADGVGTLLCDFVQVQQRDDEQGKGCEATRGSGSSK